MSDVRSVRRGFQLAPGKGVTSHLRRALGHRAECDAEGPLVELPELVTCQACLLAYEARRASWHVQLARMVRRRLRGPSSR